MAEIKGALLASVFFVTIIMPAILSFGIDSLHRHSFMKMTTEYSDLVKEEGGMGVKTKVVTSELEKRGYTITIKNQNNVVINDQVNYGDVLSIDYKYKYKGVRKEMPLHTKNRVSIMKRNL